jgi:hypothetical protein
MYQKSLNECIARKKEKKNTKNDKINTRDNYTKTSKTHDYHNRL